MTTAEPDAREAPEDAKADDEPAKDDKPPKDPEPPKDAKQPKDAEDSEGPDESDPAGGLGDERRYERLEEYAFARGLGHRTFDGRSSLQVVFAESVQGNIVGGDQHRRDDGTAAGLYAEQVPRTGRTALARVFVEPPEWRQMTAALRDRHLLVLRGRRGWGRTATAIALLSDLEAVHKGTVRGELAELPVAALPRRSGFVIDDVGERLAKLDSLQLEMFEDRLRQRDSKAVVVVDARATPAGRGAGRLAVEMTGPPDARALLEAHLTEQLGAHARCRELLDEEDTAALLDSVTADTFEAQILAELALDLADADRGLRTTAEARDDYRDRARTDVADWLDEIAEDARLLALACSTAVFDGLNCEAVQRGAAVLEKVRTPKRVETASEPPAIVKRDALLGEVRARTVPETRTGRYGEMDVELAAFVNERYPPQILEHVWKQYNLRQPLLEWLLQMSQDVELAVAVRAASAVGYFARFSFPLVRREVIGPWARSERANEREFAVVALEMLAQDPARIPQALNLVAEWAAAGEGNRHRLTAARALGSGVGTVLPGGPDRDLAALAEGAAFDLALSVAKSLRELFTVADGERSAQLLSMMERWAGENRRGRRTAGVAGFLECADLRVRTQYRGERVTCPLLLVRASTSGDFADTGDPGPGPAERIGRSTAALLAAALLTPELNLATGVMLRSWVATARRSPALGGELFALLERAAPTHRHENIMRHHLKRLSRR